jgi:hypothetical protein
MARIITKGQIGLEDMATGTSTFTRATSTGGTQSLTQIPISIAGGALTLLGNTTLASGVVLNTCTLNSCTLNTSTLTQPSNGNSVTLLNQQTGNATLTGNGADQTVFTYTIPANTIGAGKGFRVRIAFLHATGSASVTYKLILGASTIESLSYANLNNTAYDVFTYEIFNASGVQNVQNVLRQSLVNLSTGIITNALLVSSSVDLTVSQALKWTFNVAATDQIIQKFWLVELIQ